MVRLRSKTCPWSPRLSGAGGDEVTRANTAPLGRPTGDGRCRRSPAATLTAGECGVKDQVSRPQLTQDIPTTDQEDRPTPDVAPEQHRQPGGEQVEVVIAHGRRIVSDQVRALTKEKVGRLGHLCPGLDRAEVHFSEEHNPRIADREWCEVIIIGHGRSVRARAAGPSPWWPSTWWWRSSSTSSRRPRADWSAAPTPAAGRPTRSRSSARRSVPPERGRAGGIADRGHRPSPTATNSLRR